MGGAWPSIDRELSFVGAGLSSSVNHHHSWVGGSLCARDGGWLLMWNAQHVMSVVWWWCHLVGTTTITVLHCCFVVVVSMVVVIGVSLGCCVLLLW